MPKKTKVSHEALRLAGEAAQKARTADDLRTAQAVLVPVLLKISDRITGQLIGRSRPTVARLRKKFSEVKSNDRNWGGRRHGYMNIEQEREFLSGFFDKDSHRGVLVVDEVKHAFEIRVGHKVAKSTIYRILNRHGRKIASRHRHPKKDAEAQKDLLKETSERKRPRPSVA